jgi:hypothetical protein
MSPETFSKGSQALWQEHETESKNLDSIAGSNTNSCWTLDIKVAIFTVGEILGLVMRGNDSHIMVILKCFHITLVDMIKDALAAHAR